MRCPKCNIDLLEEKFKIKNRDFITLDLICSAGNCPTDEVNKENGCKLCGTKWKYIIKCKILDALQNEN